MYTKNNDRDAHSQLTEVFEKGAPQMSDSEEDVKAILVQKVLHYAKTLHIVGLGPTLIKQLVADGTITNTFDLYSLRPELLYKYINIGPKKAHQVVRNIEKTRTCAFHCWLNACGIPKIGTQKAVTIARNVGNFSEFLNLATQETKIAAQIGPKLARSFCVWVSANASVLESFANFDFQFTRTDSLRTKPLFGKVFIFTGKFNTFTRYEATQRIQQLGGTVRQNLNKNTHFIVQGTGPSNTKIVQAKLLMCKLLSEEDFITFLNTIK